MSKDRDLKNEIVAAGANVAPRITPDGIEANISNEVYFTAQHGVDGAMASLELHCRHPGGSLHCGSLRLLTFCVLTLNNGFTVTGESACASPENFDAEIGRKVARQNAISKIWPLMGYALKQRLHDAEVLQRALVDDDHPLRRA